MTHISVIIPTVQKKLMVLNKLLELLEKDEGVDEIFVINNKPEAPLTFDNTKKTEMIIPDENLYVCPSWNLGIELIKNDKFAIINDDLLVPEGFCSMILKSGILDKETTGLVGLNPLEMKSFQKTDTQTLDVPKIQEGRKIEFQELKKYLGTGDWGSCIFGRKDSYYRIPDDFKIIWGDNYLLYQNRLNNKKNYLITGIPTNHIHSSSSTSLEYALIVIDDIKSAKSGIYFPKEEVDRFYNSLHSVQD